MRTLEEVREHLKLHFYNENDCDKIYLFLRKKGLQYDGFFLEFKIRRKSLLDTYESYNGFINWFKSNDIWDKTWKSCDKLIEMYENIATDILHKEVTDAFDGSIDFNDFWSKLKEETERSENVFIKNKDGKLYKYQGGIRRELEQELIDRITLFDFISSLSIKNKDEDYIDYLREKMEEINNKLFELDEE